MLNRFNNLKSMIETSIILDSVFRNGVEYGNKEVGAYVTWYDDPSTNIMLHYQTVDNSLVECLYRKQGTVNWKTIDLFADNPFKFTNRRVRWFKLEGLEPNTVYETKLKNHEVIHKFKTMPSNQLSDIKFVLTSDQADTDVLLYKHVKNGLEQMFSLNPDAVIIAGDAMHDNGERYWHWTKFWDEWFKVQAKNDNFLTPLIVALGNHDGSIRHEDGSLWKYLYYSGGARYEHVGFYRDFFSCTGELGYNVIDINDYLSIILLNSGHTEPIEGTQTEWLESVLQDRVGRHVFPITHIGAYPGRYPYESGLQKDVRDNWSPLFTEYGVKVVGHGHEHVSLVTKKVTGDSLDENGVVYIGQGYGIGTNIREAIVNSNTWYVDFIQDATTQGVNVRGFNLITFKQDGDVVLKKINLDGDILYDKTL